MTRTQCIGEQMEFQGLGSRRVIAAANGGAVTSDAGGLLLRETERGVKLIAGFAACFEDGRDPRRVEHELGALLRQRVYAPSGHEDLNDHERLRFDLMLEILSGKLAPTRRKGGPALAGKSTLNRLERLAGDGDERYHKAYPARRSTGCWWRASFGRRSGCRGGSFWTWTHRRPGVTAVRRGVSSTAITVITATFRFISSAGIPRALGFGPPTSTPLARGWWKVGADRSPDSGALARGVDPASGGFGLLARVDHGLVRGAGGGLRLLGGAQQAPGQGGERGVGRGEGAL